MNHQSFCRRAFLRGVGVSMALPWMESFRVWGDEARRSRRERGAGALAVLFAGNGFHGKEWWAKGSGRNLELGQVLAPLTDFRERMLFIRGLYNAEALKGNIHSSQTGNLLSGAPLASGGEIRSGTSFDQLLARSHGKSTKVPSLVWLRKVEPIGSQELLHALQLPHFVDVADDSHTARTLPRPGLRSVVPRRGRARAIRACSTPCYPTHATFARASA